MKAFRALRALKKSGPSGQSVPAPYPPAGASGTSFGAPLRGAANGGAASGPATPSRAPFDFGVGLRGFQTAAVGALPEAVATATSTTGTSYGKLALAAGAAAASFAGLKSQQSAGEGNEQDDIWEGDLDTLPWRPQGRHVHQTKMPGQILRSHPIGKFIADQDHMFDGLQEQDMVKDVRCYYDTQDRKFHCIVSLGDNVCGYPRTVHGGLTAALIDESFGGLYVSMLQRGALGARLPGVTARLEVDYKNKLPHNSVIMCTCELETVEGRKVWMKATVCNGDGTKVYATARALFVAPSMRKWASAQAARIGRVFRPADAK